MGQIYTIPKYQKGNWKKNMQFPRKQEKMQPPRQWAQLSIWRSRIGILDRHTIKLYKKKMDSKFIKSKQRSLERSHAVFTEINPEFWSRPSPFSKNQILIGLLVTKVYKIRTMKISLFNYSMLGYISPTTASLPHVYRRNSCPTHIFKPTHQTGL